MLGARGKVGSEVCRAVEAADDTELVAGVDAGDPIDELVRPEAQAVVDFTHPDVVMDNLEFCIDHGIHAVVGTTGFDAGRLEPCGLAGALARHRRPDGPQLLDRRDPDDAVRGRRGAVLRVRRGGRAAPPRQGRRALRHRPAYGGADRRGPSRGRLGPIPDATTTALEGARGAEVDGIRVHGLRVRGLVAHQEVLLGGPGETLTIRHDSLDRVSFIPGVLPGLRAIGARPGLTVGLETSSTWAESA